MARVFWFAQNSRKTFSTSWLLAFVAERKTTGLKKPFWNAKKVKAKAYLQEEEKGVYVKEWMVFDNIGKKKLLGWWY